MKSKRSKSDLEEQINRGIRNFQSPNTNQSGEEDESSISNLQKYHMDATKTAHKGSVSFHQPGQSVQNEYVGIKAFSQLQRIDTDGNITSDRMRMSDFRIKSNSHRMQQNSQNANISTHDWDKELDTYDRNWNDIDLRDSMRLNMCELTGSKFKPLILEHELNRREEEHRKLLRVTARKPVIPIQEAPAFQRLLARKRNQSPGNTNKFYQVYEKEIEVSKSLERAYPELSRKYVLPDNYAYNSGLIRLLTVDNKRHLLRTKTMTPGDSQIAKVPSQVSASKARIAQVQMELPRVTTKHPDWTNSRRELLRTRHPVSGHQEPLEDPEEVSVLARTLKQAAFKAPNKTDRQFYGRLNRLSRSLVRTVSPLDQERTSHDLTYNRSLIT